MNKRQSCLRYLAIAAALLATTLLPAQTDRGVGVRVKALDPAAAAGKQVVVLIAVNRYQEWPALQGPVRDAEEIAGILQERYCVDEVRKLYDEQATKAGILRLLVGLKESLGPEDSLLVFYAGHGHLDTNTNTGFWIPVDGGKDAFAQENWLPNGQVRGLVAGLRSRHVCVIADACFSGDLLDTNRGPLPAIDSAYFRTAYSLRSRQVLTSGASETVPDQSEFARQLKLALRENRSPYLDPLMLYDQIRRGVRTTLPLLGELLGTDHQKGAGFLLFLKEGTGNAASPSGVASVPAPPARSGGVDLADLKAQAAVRAQWEARQKQMETDFAAVESLEGTPGLVAADKATAWERFLAAYRDDNPLTTVDDSLRQRAAQKAAAWREKAAEEERARQQREEEARQQAARPAPIPSPPVSPGGSSGSPDRPESGTVQYGHYIDHGDGTITDTNTGLMWTQTDSRAATGRGMIWNEANAWVDGLTTGGHTDWRLPTVAELKTIYDPSYQVLAFDGDPKYPIKMCPIFSAGGADLFWSREDARSMSFCSGHVMKDPRVSSYDSFGARGVRSPGR